MADLKDYSKYINLIVLVVSLYIAYLLIQPFIIALLTSITIAYIFYPWHRRIRNKIKKKNLSAIITTIIVILLITVPLIFAINAITRETYLFYTISRQKIASGTLLEAECADGAICSLVNYAKNTVSDPKIMFYLQEIISRFSSYIIDNASKIPTKVATIILNMFIIVFSMFFLFRDGEEIVKKIGDFVPIKKSHQKRIIKRFSNVTYAVIYGSIITALIQGAVGGFGFFIFGVQAPLLWGAVMVLAALIPFVGPPIIWVPAGIILILSGYVSGNSIVIGKGIGLLIYGAFIISSIDNFLKPKIIGAKARVHPLLVFLGVLGGIKLFGLVGFILGPLILAFCVTFLKIYQEQRL